MNAGQYADHAPAHTPTPLRTLPPSASRGTVRQLLTGSLRSWFNLTADEQKAVLLVLGLFLLGLAARAWHVERTATGQSLPQETGTPVPGGHQTK